MSRHILFVAVVCGEDSVDSIRSDLSSVPDEFPGAEIFDLGRAPVTSLGEMYARFSQVRKVASRKYPGGQVTFDFV